MATEYKLSYTASEINEKLGKIDKNETAIAEISKQIVDLKKGTGTGWTTAQINLLSKLFDLIPFTSATAGSIADSLIASLETTASSGGGSNDDTETDNITQSGSTLIVTSLAKQPTLSGSVLTIA